MSDLVSRSELLLIMNNYNIHANERMSQMRAYLEFDQRPQEAAEDVTDLRQGEVYVTVEDSDVKHYDSKEELLKAVANKLSADGYGGTRGGEDVQVYIVRQELVLVGEVKIEVSLDIA